MSERSDENREQTELERWPLRFREPEIPEDEPFRNDALDRKKYADLLTQLLRRTETPLVLGLDSDWGTGKTTFAKMWQKQLVLDGFKTLYFNAWETDYVAEPLVALVGELDIARGKKAKKQYDKVKTAAGAVLRKIAPVIVRVATQGLVDIKNKDVEEALGELAEHTAEESIDAYRTQKDELCKFREALEDLLDEIRGDQPLVFFIDELDRCRPTFAVELLERIKHLFEVQGIVFVLVMHREQLAHSVRGLYGGEFDANAYLRRFLDFTYTLPKPQPSRYGRLLTENVGLYRTDFGDSRSLIFLMDYLEFSLRQQERCVARASLVGRALRGSHSMEEVLSVFMVLVEWRPLIFEELVSGVVNADKVLAELEEVHPGHWKASEYTPRIEALFLLSEAFRRGQKRGKPVPTQRLESYRSQSGGDPDWAGQVVQSYEYMSNMGAGPRLPMLMASITKAVHLTDGFREETNR